MSPLALLFITAALAQEPKTVTYEFPDEDPIQGELVKPKLSYILPTNAAVGSASTFTIDQVQRRRRVLTQRKVTAARLIALGDLDRREAELLELALWRRWDQAWEAGVEPPNADIDTEETAIATLRRDAIQHYDQALADPSVPEPDRVLLTRAMVAGTLQDDAVVRASLGTLLAQHPTSIHVPSAHLLLGEQAFALIQLEDAERHYRAITGGELATFAQYKLAWCLLNQGDEAGARATLTALAAGPEDHPLTAEARRDLMMLESTAEPQPTPTGTR